MITFCNWLTAGLQEVKLQSTTLSGRAIILTVLIIALNTIIPITTQCTAADFLEGFDGPKASWIVNSNSRACKIVDHRRQTQLRRAGTAAEQIIFDAKVITRIELVHRLSPARALDELTASVWVRSNRTGATLALRIVFPHLTDPQTGHKMVRWIEGDSYTADNTWQSLKCQTTKKEVQRRMQLLRASLGPEIDLQDVYVDRALIFAELGTGTTELCFDELKLGPVVNPSSEIPLMPEEIPQRAELPDIKMQHDRLLFNGQPYFMTFIPDHGEPAGELADIGVKLAWIPEYQDVQRALQFRNAGIGCIATPPAATSPEGEILDADTAGLAPLTEDFDSIWFWMLGNGITPGDRSRLSSWQKQMLSADRRRQRPLMAGVTSGERSFSRIVSMLGTSRSVQHTGLEYLAYRDWLTDRKMAARPGIFRWTWIDVEPNRELAASRRARRFAQPVIEPDQLKSQFYAAICSGVQGLGFWSTEGLFRDAVGTAETRLMLKQLHFELRLLEPWLATGSVQHHARFELSPQVASPPIAAGKKRGVTPVGHRVPSTNGKPSPTPVVPVVGKAADSPHVEATLIESDFGTLLLGMWYDPNAQFVSGQMAARNVKIVVPGIKETAKAWEITTTEIRPVKTDRNAVPGGTQITLDQFDGTVAIIISTDLGLGDKLRSQVAQMQAQSATTIVQLARAKRQRVEAVIQEISLLGHPQPDDERMLDKASKCLDQAIQDLEDKEYLKAREQADLTLRMLRVIQRAHWDAARESLAKLYLPKQVGHPSDWGFRGLLGQAGKTPHAALSPTKAGLKADLGPPTAHQISEQDAELKTVLLNAHVSGPHTFCFQTLPDHWKLINRIQTDALPSLSERAAGMAAALPEVTDLLRFGNFEQDAEFRNAGWEHLQNSIPNVAATAELVQPGDRQGYCLRLAAVGTNEKLTAPLIPLPPVTFTTPGIPVQAGQIFRIHGWIKVLRPITGSRDGFEISDSIGGPDAALHWNA
ncbi:MAG: hypothetical protein JWM11_7873, partial [Planctomycetaceae bacterium]|nr:hypothetical protein [Planctomycetaceae bacterium]